VVQSRQSGTVATWGGVVRTIYKHGNADIPLDPGAGPPEVSLHGVNGVFADEVLVEATIHGEVVKPG